MGGRGGADVEEEHDAAHSSTNANAALCGRVQGRACALVAVCVAVFKRGEVLRAPAEFLFYEERSVLQKKVRPPRPKNYIYHGARRSLKKVQIDP